MLCTYTYILVLCTHTGTAYTHQQVWAHLANWGLTALQDRWQWWLWGKWWIVQCQYMTPKWGRHHLDQEVEVRGWCPVGMAERRDTLLNVCIQVVTAGKWTHAFGNSWRYFGHVWSCLDTLYTYSTHQQNGKVSEMITAALYFVCSFIEYSTVVAVPCTKSIYMHCTYKGENVRILQQIQKVSQMIITVARCASRRGHCNASKLRIVLHCLLVWHHLEAQACLYSLPPLNSLLTVFLNYQTDIVLTMRLLFYFVVLPWAVHFNGKWLHW